MNRFNRISKMVMASAGVAVLYGGVAFAQAPMQDAPSPASTPTAPAAANGPDVAGYMLTDATKEVCKDRYPKVADKIEGSWKRTSAESPANVREQANSPDYKSALAARVKELKAGDPAQIKAVCESMSK